MGHAEHSRVSFVAASGTFGRLRALAWGGGQLLQLYGARLSWTVRRRGPRASPDCAGRQGGGAGLRGMLELLREPTACRVHILSISAAAPVHFNLLSWATLWMCARSSWSSCASQACAAGGVRRRA